MQEVSPGLGCRLCRGRLDGIPYTTEEWHLLLRCLMNALAFQKIRLSAAGEVWTVDWKDATKPVTPTDAVRTLLSTL